MAISLARPAVDPDLADYFFKAARGHRVVRAGRGLGAERVPTVLRNAVQRWRFKRAYIEKILSERRKDEGLLQELFQAP